MTAVQTIWCELLVGTLVDAGVSTVVISPGSRSTPLVAALAGSPLELVTIIDERAAAFFALGAARATHRPVALVCTSGTAGAHYLPALIEASLSNIPLLAITADRPPELLACGASQTIDQVHLYGRFVRGAFDLGTPTASPIALRALRRKIAQAITLSLGPLAGPVHLEVPLRKPLEPIAPSTPDEHALAALAHSLRGPLSISPPSLAPDATAIAELAAAIATEPDGIVVAGAMPTSFAGAALVALAERAGYPILAESGSQLRFGPRGTATFVDHADLIPIARRPTPRIVLQIGAEPVAASWPHWDLSLAQRWVLAPTWADPTSSARVILGDVTASLDALLAQSAERSAPIASFSDAPRRPSQPRVRTSAWLDTWRDLDTRAARTMDRALADHPRSETATLHAALAALPPSAAIQIGNSLPIRVIDQLPLPRLHTPRSQTRSNQVLTVVRTSANLDDSDHVRNLVESDRISGIVDSDRVPNLVEHDRVSGIVDSDRVPSLVDHDHVQNRSDRDRARNRFDSERLPGNDNVLTGVRTWFERDRDRGGADHDRNVPAHGRGGSDRASHPVITQRGAAGIDGLIASAAGATYAGPVLLVLGDVSFAHDLGGLLAARCAKAPLAILVVDNGGGQIFAGLPVAKAVAPDIVDTHWLTPPDVDPAAVAIALGARAMIASSPDEIARAVGEALAADGGVTVIHAPVSATGAHDVRRAALALMEESHDQPQPPRPARPDDRPHVDPSRGL